MSDERIIIIKKDFRAERIGPHGQAQATKDSVWTEKRTHCWDIQNCDSKTRSECYAYFTQQNCWDLWALRPLERKYCCLKIADCRECPITQTKFDAKVLPIHIPVRSACVSVLTPRTDLTRPPSLKVQPSHCQHFYIEGRPSVPADAKSLRTMIRSLSREDRDVFRCQLRHVHLEWSYVTDVCASKNHSQCVFLEDM
jgi:hypothetical protein